MADFCSICVVSDGHGRRPDIDIKAEFSQIPVGHMTDVLCEGCGMVGIAKPVDNVCVVYIRDVASGNVSTLRYDLDNNVLKHDDEEWKRSIN